MLIGTEVVHALCSMNLEEFKNSVTLEQLMVVCKLSKDYNIANRNRRDFFCWDLNPALVYSFLLNEHLSATPTSKLSKQMRMISKLSGENTDSPIKRDIYEASYDPTHIPRRLKFQSSTVYERIEWLTYNVIDSLYYRIIHNKVVEDVQVIQTLYLGFINQLEPDEYTVTDDVYTILNLKKSVERLTDSLHFNMGLIDIYSILFVKDYISPYFQYKEAVEPIITAPIKEIPSYSKAKRSYFGCFNL